MQQRRPFRVRAKRDEKPEAAPGLPRLRSGDRLYFSATRRPDARQSWWGPRSLEAAHGDGIGGRDAARNHSPLGDAVAAARSGLVRSDIYAVTVGETELASGGDRREFLRLTEVSAEHHVQ